MTSPLNNDGVVNRSSSERPSGGRTDSTLNCRCSRSPFAAFEAGERATVVNEIQQASRVMAVNAYPEVPGGAGQIKLWNVEPDVASRQRLGLKYSSIPIRQSC